MDAGSCSRGTGQVGEIVEGISCTCEEKGFCYGESLNWLLLR